jgi:hypothetical protein
MLIFLDYLCLSSLKYYYFGYQKLTVYMSIKALIDSIPLITLSDL